MLLSMLMARRELSVWVHPIEKTEKYIRQPAMREIFLQR